MSAVVHPLHRFIRPSATSTTNCPGCGNGIVAQAILRAIDELSLTMDDFVYVSGIGCSAWIPSPFFNGDVLHTTHGRPIAFALGIKMGLPDKRVMVVSGDGDLTAIGGNHLIHNARRNVDMIVICLNNGIYGMTGGQAAPTTPMGMKTTTTPYGSFENPFDISRLVIAAGASFVARWTTHHPRQITSSIKKAMQRKGFSFIEVITQCPVQFGKKTGSGSAVQTQAYSSEQRGGMARAEVILASDPITDPQVRKPDILIALAEDAIVRHLHKVKPAGRVVIDSDLVKDVKPGDYEILSIPATSLAEKEMGNIVVANLILLGGLIQKTGILSVEAMEKAIAMNVPAKAKELNLKAFRRGLELN